MDAAAKRRAIRKRKILQNAEDRMKKLTGNAGVDLKHEENVDKETNFCEANDKDTLKFNGINDDHQNANDNVDSSYTHKDKVDGYDYRKEREHETEKKTNNETFHSQITAQNSSDVKFPSLEDDCKEKGTETDAHIRKGKVDETANEQLIEENGIEFSTESEAIGSGKANVRTIVVILFATLCFTKSHYMPVVFSIVGSPWSDIEFSFIIPFCILEIILYFTPNIKKVMPTKQVNIWLLALKLCGISPGIVDAIKVWILEILEILTDLAMFVFALVILQNMKELVYIR
ncbi:uncharacterized protein LOC114524559 [Dendronephthya gigantea]|uniref:uncharacterized protein LOC114524559 n=1 Tax=Dendronephthya gigantea TaxID=151771 RepID=UPI00106BF56E|nr:uncharacterized protein LOC114524559 [Dendronephthya gigantea]